MLQNLFWLVVIHQVYTHTVCFSVVSCLFVICICSDLCLLHVHLGYHCCAPILVLICLRLYAHFVNTSSTFVAKCYLFCFCFLLPVYSRDRSSSSSSWWTHCHNWYLFLLHFVLPSRFIGVSVTISLCVQYCSEMFPSFFFSQWLCDHRTLVSSKRLILSTNFIIVPSSQRSTICIHAIGYKCTKDMQQARWDALFFRHRCYFWVTMCAELLKL